MEWPDIDNRIASDRVKRKFGELLRTRRKLKGESQYVAAARFTMAQSGYQRLEVGQSLPCFQTLVRICRDYGIGLDELAGCL